VGAALVDQPVTRLARLARRLHLLELMQSNRRNSAPGEINLIPLMNLFVTMIPLLLLSAAFYHVGMVSVSVPGQSRDGEGRVLGQHAVDVSVQMTAAGYTITAANEQLSDTALRSFDAVIPKRSGELDLKDLRRALSRIKRRYHESDTVVVVPSRETSYEEMIATMDAARYLSDTPSPAGHNAPTLFPVVVVASLVE
jgi:biopolymer transport protein ExbD